MTKNNDPNKESLVDIAVDPDVLARELALEIEIDPLEQIDEDSFPKDLNITQECNEALKMLKGNREERIQGLRIFCEYRDSRSFPLLLPLLDQPCPVERMSVVYMHWVVIHVLARSRNLLFFWRLTIMLMSEERQLGA